jgi:hypothetical protein
VSHGLSDMRALVIGLCAVVTTSCGGGAASLHVDCGHHGV